MLQKQNHMIQVADTHVSAVKEHQIDYIRLTWTALHLLLACVETNMCSLVQLEIICGAC